MKLTCFRISNCALDGEELPVRIKILDWGDNPNVNGAPIRVTERTLRVLPANQKRSGRDTVALDYEHNTVPGSDEYARTAEPRKVAGYGSPAIVEGDGLYLEMQAYTPSGRENAREYMDLSPAVYMDDRTREVTALHSVALCRQGAVEGLQFFAAPDFESAMLEEEQTKGNEMDEVKNDEVEKDEGAAMHGEEASDDAALADIKSVVLELKERLDKMQAPEKFSALEAKVDALKSAIATDGERRDKQEILRQARSEGKVVALSADAVEAIKLDDLKAHVAAIKPSVPLHQYTQESEQEHPERLRTNLERIAKLAGVKMK